MPFRSPSPRPLAPSRPVAPPRRLTLALLAALTAAACTQGAATFQSTGERGPAPSPEGGEPEVTGIALGLMMTPPDVRCVRAVVTGPVQVMRTFDTTPGSTKVFSFNGLPVGHVSLFVDAFNVACTGLLPTTPATWVAPEAIELDLLPGRIEAVPLRLRPASGVEVSVDFQPVTPGLFFDVEKIDFGVVPLGSSGRRRVGLLNFTGTPLTPSFVFTGEGANQFSARLVGGGSAPAACRGGTTIPANTQCPVDVVFAPTDAGEQASVLEVGPNLRLPVSGIGARSSGVTLVPSSIDLGSVDVGKQALQTLTLTNASFATYTTSADLAFSSDFSIMGGTCLIMSTLPVGASCTYVIGFAPRSVGPATGELIVGSELRTSLRGNGLAAVMIEWNANFEEVVVGQSSDRLFTVRNLTAAAVTLVPRFTGAQEFTVAGGTCGATLAAGESCTIVVRFTPAQEGSRRATLSPGAGSNVVTMTGVGIAAGGTVKIDPQFFRFPPVVAGTSADVTLTLSNDSAVAFTVAPTFTGNDATQFRIAGGSCGATLAPAASCTLTARFAPTSSGPKTALLVAGGGPVTTFLEGTGITAGVSLSPLVQHFGVVVPGQFEDVAFTITNGTANAFAVSVFFSGTHAADFRRAGGTCGASLASTASCTVMVRFAPVTSGTKDATLSIGAGAPTAKLSGFGFDDGISYMPSHHDFGSVQVGAIANHVFTLSNNSMAVINPNVSVTGTAFALVTGEGTCAAMGTMLPPGSSCTFVISFSPTSTGGKSGTFSGGTLAGTGVGGWIGQDVGAVGMGGEGSFLQDGNAFTVKGGGADIWGTNDAFYFVSQEVVGDARITARITEIELVNDWAKAGVMIRDLTGGPGARNVMALMPANRANQFRLQRRTAFPGSTTGTAGGAAPVAAWLRLVRKGNEITAFTSTNGTTFTALGAPVTMTLPASLSFGLAVTSHVAGKTARAVFSNVEIVKP